MKKATAGIEFGSYNRLQSMLGKAVTLASGWIYHNDPGWYAKDLAETRAVTAADVKRVANTYLGADRIVLSAVPMGKRELAAHADQSTPITSPFAAKETRP
jgi:zinc protease